MTRVARSVAATRFAAVATRSATVAKRLAAIAAVACLGVAHAATLTVTVTGADGQPLPNAVVHVVPANGTAPLARAPTAIVDQVDREFVPLVSAVQTGTVLRFPNRDNVRHSVFSFSPAKRFQIKLYAGETADPVTLDKPGLVVLGCNIHDKMVAYVMVVDTPWFAVTDAKGVARIANVPAGEVEAVAWHYRQGDETQSARQAVKIAGDRALAFALTLRAPMATMNH